ncbi:MAG: toprim domain-containing protein [Novosphingobium sp.]|nr:toprim domain-containing protein [Novosphingobium sp.]
MADPVIAFLDAMGAAGISPADSIAGELVSGKPIYFDCIGDKPKSRKGWAVLHLDGYPAGAFGHFKSGINQKWRFKDNRTLSPQERREIARQSREAAALREAEQQAQWEEIAEVCRHDWERAEFSADPAHPYLVAKGIPGEDARQLGNRLVIPMFDEHGKLWNLQRIAPDGFKLYTKNARTKGLFMTVGEPGDKIVVAEGYGTGAVIRRATSLSVVVAFTWTNLKPVALQIRNRFPDAEIIIAADDDAHLIEHPNIQRNIGLEAARAAAEAVGGRLAVPPRKEAR